MGVYSEDGKWERFWWELKWELKWESFLKFGGFGSEEVWNLKVKMKILVGEEGGREKRGRGRFF